MAQQSKPNLTDIFPSLLINQNGKVKTITIQIIRLYNENKLLNNETPYGSEWTLIGETTIKYFNTVGNLDSVITYSPYMSRKFIIAFLYDTLNNIIEIDKYYHEKEKTVFKTFHYDSADNWIETRDYNIKNQPYLIHKRFYNKNIVTELNYYTDTLTKYKSTFMYYKHNTITYNYLEGKLHKKIIDKIKGNNHYKYTQIFSSKDGSVFKEISYHTNSKKGYSTEAYLKDGKKNNLIKTEWKYNTHGDVISEKTVTLGFPSNYILINGTIIKSFDYTYDSHGNFTKKTEYINGFPAYETTRSIEYYD